MAHVLDGHNVCLFAFGHMGCGKTFTMEGINNDRLYQIICKMLFEDIEKSEGLIKYEVTISVMEVYRDNIYVLSSNISKGKKTRIPLYTN